MNTISCLITSSHPSSSASTKATANAGLRHQPSNVTLCMLFLVKAVASEQCWHNAVCASCHAEALNCSLPDLTE
jgi:hypothetical protein